jgi:hypothetical protein
MPARPVALVAALIVAGASSAVSADAGTANVRLAAIGRSGATSPISGSAINLSTGKVYALNAGAAAALPGGRYVVGSYINDYPAMTVAARTVTIGRSTTVTFDARKGKKVTFNVGDPSVAPVDLAVVPFARVKGKEIPFIRTTTHDWPASNTYVLPDSAAEVRLGIHAVLGKADASGPVRYDLAYSRKGMPAAVSFSTSKAKLARVDLNVATVDADQNSFLELTAKRKDLTPVTGVRVGAPVLGRQTSYRTPGLQWGSVLAMNSLSSSAFLEEDQKAKKLLYAAGRTYREEWGLGVWGPRPTSPAIYSQDGQLRIAGGPPICAFGGTGVTLAAPTGGCQLQPQAFSYTLTRAGKALGKGETVAARIDAKKPQWYTATMSASRGGGDLATKVSAKWYFQAGGTTRTETPTLITIRENQVAPGYIRILVKGADERNRVAPGSRTTLTMSVQKFGKVAGMALKYSTDGGATWKAAKVAHKGSNWVATVPAPGSGAVSLRASAKSASGATVEQTVVNAYGVR